MNVRIGYSNYLVFLFGFSNFLLILYNFFPAIKTYIEFHVFAVIMFFVITPLCIWLGHMHNKKQMPTEAEVAAKLNPYKTKLVPESKEVMNNEYSIVSIEHSLWSLGQTKWNYGLSKWNMEVTKKNMELMNFIAKALHAPEELQYKKEFDDLNTYMKDVDRFSIESQNWLSTFEVWKDRFQKLQEGKDVKEAMS
jgi:hypothetical protein